MYFFVVLICICFFFLFGRMVVCVWFLESIILYIFYKEVCYDLNVYVDFVIDF